MDYKCGEHKLAANFSTFYINKNNHISKERCLLFNPFSFKITNLILHLLNMTIYGSVVDYRGIATVLVVPSIILYISVRNHHTWNIHSQLVLWSWFQGLLAPLEWAWPHQDHNSESAKWHALAGNSHDNSNIPETIINLWLLLLRGKELGCTSWGLGWQKILPYIYMHMSCPYHPFLFNYADSISTQIMKLFII